MKYIANFNEEKNDNAIRNTLISAGIVGVGLGSVYSQEQFNKRRLNDIFEKE